MLSSVERNIPEMLQSTAVVLIAMFWASLYLLDSFVKVSTLIIIIINGNDNGFMLGDHLEHYLSRFFHISDFQALKAYTVCQSVSKV